jgi:hypothetical protein
LRFSGDGYERKKKIKDIFVDSCVAVRLENPVDPSLVGLLEWLAEHGAPVITPKILKEYNDSLDACSSNFIAIINACQRDGRFIEISNDELKSLSFSKKIEKKLLSNRKDWWHIKAVILSPRKLAISFDNNFVQDVNNFPGHKARASRSAADLAYK